MLFIAKETDSYLSHASYILIEAETAEDALAIAVSKKKKARWTGNIEVFPFKLGKGECLVAPDVNTLPCGY